MPAGRRRPRGRSAGRARERDGPWARLHARGRPPPGGESGRACGLDGRRAAERIGGCVQISRRRRLPCVATRDLALDAGHGRTERQVWRPGLAMMRASLCRCGPPEPAGDAWPTVRGRCQASNREAAAQGTAADIPSCALDGRAAAPPLYLRPRAPSAPAHISLCLRTTARSWPGASCQPPPPSASSAPSAASQHAIASSSLPSSASAIPFAR